MAKSKKVYRPIYALIDVTMGDTLAALVTCSPCSRFLVDASKEMHQRHSFRHDFVVFRSTDLGYFGGKATPLALNGDLITE